MAFEKFKDMSYEELMKDIEESFNEMMEMLTTKYNPQDGLREVKGMMAALGKILDEVGKTFHRAGTSLKGKASKVVTEASVVFLKNAHEMKRPLNNIDDAIKLFREVVETSLKQVKKMDKALKNDEDTTEKTIHRTIRQVLSKMKEQADAASARNKS